MATVPATIQERFMLPSQQVAGSGSASPSPGDIIAMLKRRMVLIIMLFVVFSGIGVGLFFLAYFKFPQYTAEALIECISDIPQGDYSTRVERPDRDEFERFVETQATLLKSPSILEEALKLTAVKDTQWYKSIPAGEHLLELTDDLSANALRGTNFLKISISTTSRADPHVIVNSVANNWLRSVKQRSADAFKDQLDAARNELTRLDQQIAQQKDQLNRIAAELPPGVSAGDINPVAQEVMLVNEQVERLQLELSMLEQFRQVYNDPSGVALSAEDVQIIEADPRIQALTLQVDQFKQQISADSQVFGDEHPETRRLRNQLDAAEADLEKRRTQLTTERRINQRELANTTYANTQYALLSALERQEKAEASLQDQDRKLYEFNNLQEEIKTNVTRRLELEAFITTLSRIISQRTAVRVAIAQQAIEPLERSFPQLIFLPAGIIMALGLSIAIGLGLEFMNTSVRTTQDIARHLEIAILGAVPDVDDEEITIEHVETAVRDAPRSMIAEAFRRIRTNLQFSAPASHQRAIMVTSPLAEDGKTTVACNLGMVVAQGGRRVLLVDANFRRAGMERVFPECRGPGLSNILIGEGSLTQFTHPTGVPMLDVMGSGPITPNPAELLGSEAFTNFLEDAVSRYDQVIVDTAPVLLASDAMVVSTAMDGCIMVLRAKENSRGVARRAYGVLQGVNAHFFGAVLNAAQVTRGGYFREQFRAYYDYQVEGEQAAKALPGSDEDAGDRDARDGNGGDSGARGERGDE